MTAYVSRLFLRPGQSAGIRKRPRSRYEPEPETYLSRDPIEIDLEPGEEQLPADRTTTIHAHRRHAVDPAATPEVPSESAPEQTFSALAGPTVAAVAPELTTPPARREQHDADQRPNRGDPDDIAPAARIEASVRPQPGDAMPASPPSISDTPAPRVAPGEDRRSDSVAVPVHSAIPPAAIEEPGQEQSPHVRHARPHALRQPTPAAPEPRVPEAPRPDSEPYAPFSRPETSKTQPADTPAQADLAIAHRSPTPEPIRAPRLPGPNAKSPDPMVRQTIVNAIAEPVRAQTTEVVVHIDRIDVHTPTSTPPAPPEPRRARAAPTSLESYLRSRSRRGAR